MKKNKVFGIGLSKTVTKSLAKALEILGYKAMHYPDSLDWIDKYDAATDIPVASSYKELDKKYPNAKFILTVRDLKSWFRSMDTHSVLHPFHAKSEISLAWRKKTWGSVDFNEARRKRVYKKHVREVKEYFKKRKNKLLIMDICGGDGWEKLCPFLNKPIPKRKFPKLNVTKNKRKYKNWLAAGRR